MKVITLFYCIAQIMFVSTLSMNAQSIVAGKHSNTDYPELDQLNK